MGSLKPTELLKTEIKQLSDAELLEQQFKTDDPENLSGVSSALPTDYKDAEIEFWYDVNPGSGKTTEDRSYVWCAHCGKVTHWKGYVMKSSSDARFLIGAETCGRKLYGLDFNQTENKFDTLRSRQNYLFRWNATIEALPNAVDGLSEFLKNPILRQFEEARSGFEREMNDLYVQLNKAISRNDGRLLIDERVRDFEAEQRRNDTYDQEDQAFEASRQSMTLTAFKEQRKEFKKQKNTRNRGEIYKTVQRETGRIAGDDFLKSRATPIQIISGCIADLRNLHGEMKGQATEQFSNQKMSTTLTKVKNYIANVETELKRLRAASGFFQLNNLTTIATWTSKVPEIRGQYKVRARTLIKEDANRDVQISLPSDYKVPMNIVALETLKVALTRAN